MDVGMLRQRAERQQQLIRIRRVSKRLTYIYVEDIQNIKRFQRKLPGDILWRERGQCTTAAAAAYQIGDSRLARSATARRAKKKSVALAVGR